MLADLDRLYALLAQLAAAPLQSRRLQDTRDPTVAYPWRVFLHGIRRVQKLAARCPAYCSGWHSCDQRHSKSTLWGRLERIEEPSMAAVITGVQSFVSTRELRYSRPVGDSWRLGA